ncbi:MAG: hypothetical protein V4722_22295 [Bacteroidota bacterium]
MAASISVQSGYILKAEAIAAGTLPLKFRINPATRKIEMECKIVFPTTLGGVKENPTGMPDDPTQWQYGEIEVLLDQNLNSNGSPVVFFTGIEGDLTLNVQIKINAKKVWQMGAGSKVWQMG